jgi:hypothetical protein
VSGTWTFALGGRQWSQHATVRIPAKDGTDHKISIIELNVNKKPPTDCPKV